MASLFEKILKSVNSGVSIEEALAKHGTNQEVIDELLGVSSATNEHVLTKDTSTGKAIFKANPGGSTATTTSEGIVELATDAEVIAGTDTSRVPSVSSLRNGLVVSGTPQTTTSGTAFDYTSIPSWAKNIALVMEGVSLSGTDHLLVQIGDSGGIETTGYISSGCAVVTSSAGATNSTSGFIIYTGVASRIFSGILTIRLLDSNLWVSSHSGKFAASAGGFGGGDKTLSDTLDRIRLTRTGTNTFDAGSVNILYW